MRRFIILLIGILLLSSGVAGEIYHYRKKTNIQQSSSVPYQATQAGTVPISTDTLLRETNKARQKFGSQPLPEDSRLDASAQRKADEEVKYNYFGHISPVDGVHGYQYIFDSYPECKYGSEILTDNINVNNAASAINAWLSSPAHRSALLNPNNFAVGIGIAGTEIVEHFCLTDPLI